MVTEREPETPPRPSWAELGARIADADQHMVVKPAMKVRSFLLDDQVKATPAPDHEVGRVLSALASAAALLVALTWWVQTFHPPIAVADVIAEGALAALFFAAARASVRVAGSWREAVGLAGPSFDDIWLITKWLIAGYLAAFVAAVVLSAAIPSLHHYKLGNAGFLRHLGPADRDVVVLLAIFVAPIVEEVFFRGLLLRALMRRTGFGTAAFVSSLLFGVAHAHEVRQLVPAVALAVQTGTFGLVQCALVRRTGRLGPNIVTHALRNAIVVLAVLG